MNFRDCLADPRSTNVVWRRAEDTRDVIVLCPCCGAEVHFSEDEVLEDLFEDTGGIPSLAPSADGRAAGTDDSETTGHRYF